MVRVADCETLDRLGVERREYEAGIARLEATLKGVLFVNLPIRIVVIVS